MPDVVVDRLTVTYTSGGYAVSPIDGLSFAAPTSSLTLLLGPSGCGKTTLLSCLAGILPPTSGSIRFGTTEVTELRGTALTTFRREDVGVVFQAFNLVPSMSALENVMVPIVAAGTKRRAASARATELLTTVGLADRVAHRPSNLSGGQQQRVAIARALALDPAVIVADEPTANLDHVQVETVLRILRSLVSEGRTIIVSTHDSRLLPLADQVIDMAAHGGERVDELVALDIPAGDDLFTQGSMGDRIFEVVSGRLAIMRSAGGGAETQLAVVGPGDQFGEMGPVFNLPRSATARAIEQATVVSYSVKEYRDQFGIDRLMGLIAQRAPQDEATLRPA
jgi:putative ABC transport system ATP-binding protein